MQTTCTDRPTPCASQLPVFTIGDKGTLRRLAAGPLARHWLDGWRGHGDSLRYLEARGMVRLPFDWTLGAIVAALTQPAAQWLATETATATS